MSGAELSSVEQLTPPRLGELAHNAIDQLDKLLRRTPEFAEAVVEEYQRGHSVFDRNGAILMPLEVTFIRFGYLYSVKTSSDIDRVIHPRKKSRRVTVYNAETMDRVSKVRLETTYTHRGTKRRYKNGHVEVIDGETMYTNPQEAFEHVSQALHLGKDPQELFRQN